MKRPHGRTLVRGHAATLGVVGALALLLLAVLALAFGQGLLATLAGVGAIVLGLLALLPGDRTITP